MVCSQRVVYGMDHVRVRLRAAWVNLTLVSISDVGRAERLLQNALLFRPNNTYKFTESTIREVI